MAQRQFVGDDVLRHFQQMKDFYPEAWGSVLELGYSGLAKKISPSHGTLHTTSIVDTSVEVLNQLEVTEDFDYLVVADPVLFMKALSESVENGSCGTKRRKFVGSKVKIFQADVGLDESYDKLLASLATTLPALFIVNLAVIRLGEVTQLKERIVDLLKRGDFVLLCGTDEVVSNVVDVVRSTKPLLLEPCPLDWTPLKSDTGSCLILRKAV